MKFFLALLKKRAPLLIVIFGSILINTLLIYGFPILYFFKTEEKVEEKPKSQKIQELVKEEKEPEKKKVQKFKVENKEELKSKPQRSDRFQLKLSAEGKGVGISSDDIKNLVFKEGDVDKAAKPVNSVAPEYPIAAQNAGITGKVELSIVIDETGNPQKVEALSEEPSGFGFKEAAIQAAYQWRFKPAMKNNIPVKMEYVREINFE